VTTTILVTGGTGTVGRPVVERLLRAGHHVRVASRRPRPPVAPVAWATVDYRSGGSLDAAVAGAEVIVHCAVDYRGHIDRAVITAARRAGIPHLVYVSIVGVDRISFFYYRAKLASEHLIARSGLGWTILRTTQFHDLLCAGLARLSRLPALPVLAGVRWQPVDTREVAVHLADLAVGSPAGRVADMGGPQVRGMDDLARSWLRATGRDRRLLQVRVPGRAFAGFRDGYHLAPDRAVGTRTFEQYLDERLGRAAMAAQGSR
jgi:uncharacterized protein YbjT (DUF2867 family)